MIFVNFKTYKEGTGIKAVELARDLSSCQSQAKIPVIPVVQATDIRLCVAASLYEVWVQHVDPIEYGKNTGWILPEAVTEAGAIGTFLNHSEHKVPDSTLQETLERCKEAGLKVLVFAADIKELEQVVKFKPDYVAYEPPELVGSTTTSVSRAKPEIIKEAAEVTKKAGIPLIVGAGVKDSTDVKVSIELGAVGVAVSSAIVLAENPKKVVLELAEGFE
ncbi:MAG: triose-phosphate isomerase [bacterium]|nr:triose-phosphate isomerase [bacterium]